MHLSCTYLSLWYIWRKPCTYLAPTLTLSPKERSEIPHDPRHLGVPSGVAKMISEPMVRSMQTVQLSCVEISTISERNKTSFHLSLCHQVVPSGACKTISEPMVHLARTMHLSCTDRNTVSKCKEGRFHMTLVS